MVCKTKTMVGIWICLEVDIRIWNCSFNKKKLCFILTNIFHTISYLINFVALTPTLHWINLFTQIFTVCVWVCVS